MINWTKKMKTDKKTPKRKLSQKKLKPHFVKQGNVGDVVDMEEAIDLLKTTRPTFYRWPRSGKIKGMKVGRQWRFFRDDIDRMLKGEAPRIDLPADITPLVETLRKQARKAGAKDLVPNGADELQQTLNLMIVLGLSTRASDIHIGPLITKFGAQATVSIRMRIDCVLHEIAPIDIRLLPAIIDGLKRMAGCDLHEKEKPQDGRALIRLADLNDPESDKLIDIRACFLPTGLGESATLRIMDPLAASFDLSRIEYSPEDKARLMRALKLPAGIVVVSGPTGSGKTTVLYACLNELTGPGRK